MTIDLDVGSITHRRGMWWYEAPAPPKRHEHQWETRAWFNELSLIERCACGARRYDKGPWLEEVESSRRIAPRHRWFRR